MTRKVKPAFVKILTTDNLADIAMIKTALDGSGNGFYIQGENMKFIRPVDSVMVFVANADVKKA